MIRRAARALGGLLLVIGLGLGVFAAIEHGAARGAWARESARLERGEEAYDPEASDAHYLDALAQRERAALFGWVAAPGWVILALGLGRGEPAGEERRGRAVHAAVLADSALVIALAVAGAYAEGWLGATHAAWGALAGTQLTALALAVAWAATATGVSMGGQMTQTTLRDASGRPPGVARGFAALLLWPIGLLFAPLALAFWPSSRPPHLAWVGLATVRRII